MTPEAIEQAWDDALIMLVNSTARKTEKTAIRAYCAALRDEMQVQAAMIQAMAVDLHNHEAGQSTLLGAEEQIKQYRADVEAKMKGESDAFHEKWNHRDCSERAE